jgi:hypothetical protein
LAFHSIFCHSAALGLSFRSAAEESASSFAVAHSFVLAQKAGVPHSWQSHRHEWDAKRLHPRLCLSSAVILTLNQVKGKDPDEPKRPQDTPPLSNQNTFVFARSLTPKTIFRENTQQNRVSSPQKPKIPHNQHQTNNIPK